VEGQGAHASAGRTQSNRGHRETAPSKEIRRMKGKKTMGEGGKSEGEGGESAHNERGEGLSGLMVGGHTRRPG